MNEKRWNEKDAEIISAEELWGRGRWKEHCSDSVEHDLKQVNIADLCVLDVFSIVQMCF